ncbi:ABC transporter permease [soil metagenome]
MIAKALRRFAWSLFVIWATVSIAFLVNNAVPGDPARMVAGPQARPAEIQQITKQLGLDRPLHVQYARFMGRLVHLGPSTIEKGDKAHASCSNLGPIHFDLGMSYVKRRPVAAIIAERFPRTLLLAVLAVILQAGIGVVTGTFAAAKKKTIFDQGTVALTLIGVSAPTFVIGLVLQHVFGHTLRWLPLDGYGDSASDHLLSAILPAVTLGVFGAAYYTRLVRDELLGLLGQDHVRTARAKGLGPLAVWTRHLLRNALAPLLTVVGLDLGALVGGAIVTETLFRWPGLGALTVGALMDRDGPLILGTVLVAATAVVVSNLIVDASYALLDPRIRRTR